MAKIARMKRYASEKQAIQVRTDACAFAAQAASNRDWDAGKLMALCVFFESYIASGPKWTERHMRLLEPLSEEAKPKTVVQLITRDD